jgi:DNA invertase Pin-like site-specific DNA recombinase
VTSAVFGYARVSTGAQDLTSQLKDLKAAGCERVFKEKVTGATADRPPEQCFIRAANPSDCGLKRTRPVVHAMP